MSKRKNNKKALVQREAIVYSTTWAETSDDAPPWAVERGFPLSEPPLELERLSDGAEAEVLKQIDPLVMSLSDSDMAVLRRVLDDPTWEPSAAPATGYPRLVRASYREPTQTVQHTNDVRLLNDVSNLLRWLPLGASPDKRLLKEVANLHALYGAVHEQANTLQGWLELGRMIQIHFDVRAVLQDFDTAYAKGDIISRWQSAVRSRDALEKRIYRPLYLSARERRADDDTKAFRAATASHFRQALAKPLRGARLTDASTLVIPCSVADWVLLELALFWEDSQGTAECEGCQRNFYPGRGYKSHCHPRCRVRKHEKDSKNAA